MIKSLVAWLPYILAIAMMYPLGKGFYHIRHTIIFLSVIMPLIALAFTLSIRYLLKEDDSDTAE